MQQPKNQPPQNRPNTGDSVSHSQDNHNDTTIDPSRRGAGSMDAGEGGCQPPLDASKYPPGNYIDENGLFVGREIIMDRISQMIQSLSAENIVPSTLPAAPSSTAEDVKTLSDAKERIQQFQQLLQQH